MEVIYVFLLETKIVITNRRKIKSNPQFHGQHLLFFFLWERILIADYFFFFIHIFKLFSFHSLHSFNNETKINKIENDFSCLVNGPIRKKHRELLSDDSLSLNLRANIKKKHEAINSARDSI